MDEKVRKIVGRLVLTTVISVGMAGVGAVVNGTANMLGFGFCGMPI